MKLKPTETEQEMLDQVLREMRHAAAHGAQLTILFDPFVGGRTATHAAGAHLCFSHGEAGLSMEFSGTIKRSDRPTAAAKYTAHLRPKGART